MTQRAISLPFVFNSAGQIGYTTDEKKIIQDRIVLALMSRFGERVMRPDFGSDVYLSLFEDPTSAVGIVRLAATTCFATWFPYLQFLDAQAVVSDNDVLEIEISYKRALEDATETTRIKAGFLSRSGELLQEIKNVR